MNTMISSLSPSTIKQYTATYHLWWTFCQQENTPFYHATPIQVISFLQSLLDNHPHKYGTFNSHRSALSLILPNTIGSDPILKRFMKGTSRLRPSRPKYDSTWDPQPVLNYLEHLPTDTLKALSHKLVTLLALITGGRLQTISLIRLSNMLIEEERIQIFITDPTKTSTVSKNQACLYIPFFRQTPSLCAALSLQKYVTVTGPLRKPDQDFLFISCCKPHNTISKQTISQGDTAICRH